MDPQSVVWILVPFVGGLCVGLIYGYLKGPISSKKVLGFLAVAAISAIAIYFRPVLMVIPSVVLGFLVGQLLAIAAALFLVHDI